LIPDVIVLPGIALGLFFSAVTPDIFYDLGRKESFIYSLIGAVSGGGSLLAIGLLGKIMYKKDAMGGGDVKLLAMVGAFCGWKSVLVTIFFSSLVGTLISLTLIAMKLKKMDDYIPFGPYLALGALITVFWKGYTFLGFLIP
jgi:leader peptidase (prepilin peptidase)/N-methyltransferase